MRGPLRWRQGRPAGKCGSRRLDGDDLFLGQAIPLAFSAYDLLWLNGTSLLKSPFTTRRTIINVKGEDPITITQRWSESGPILPGTHYDLGAVTPAGSS